MIDISSLKEWMSAGEAAQVLSKICETPVSVADVFHLGLTKRLVLSVHFANSVTAWHYQVTHIEKAKIVIYPKTPIAKNLRILRMGLIGPKGAEVHRNDALPTAVRERLQRGEVGSYFPGLPLDDPPNTILQRSDKTVALTGVFDLPMIGSERLDIERLLRIATGGPSVLAEHRGGTFVRRGDQLFGLNEPPEGSARWLRMPHFARLTYAAFRPSLSWLNELRWPADGFPTHAAIVVRSQAIADFQKDHSSAVLPDRSPDPGTRKLSNLMAVIAALARAAKVDLSRPSKAADQIEKLTEEIGARVSSSAISNYLKDLPDSPEGPRKNGARQLPR